MTSYIYRSNGKFGVIFKGQAAAAERPELSLALRYAEQAKIQTELFWDAEEGRFRDMKEATP